MGQGLYGSARTTAVIRRAIQRSQESLQRLATRYSINLKTVAKWRCGMMGPEPASTVLTTEQAAIAVAFRRHRLLAWRSTIAFTRCKPRFRTSRAQRCTVVSSATALAAHPSPRTGRAH